uniref:Uncharacterized protein n=1 Tax=Anguilla anguilla TaxID=7936 RepID=A0A0E9XXT8_ANGAN
MCNWSFPRFIKYIRTKEALKR